MMNFVETAPVTPRLAADAGESTLKPSVTPCQKKAFAVAFVLTVAVFSFTLLGLITTSNWITDNVVIPKMYGPLAVELQQPTMHGLTEQLDEAGVETTLAR